MSRALDYLLAVKWEGHKPGLSRTRALLEALGNPQKRLHFVHIAGTNGKGSTAAMIAACLTAAGLRTGLFTSPYLNRFHERIQVDGIPISDEDLESVTDALRPAAEAMADVPTEFELITAAGLLHFARQRCDLVVLEVGLGGLLDSTNVIDTPEVALITALGMDHVRELGPTLPDIATAKAGIIKPGGDVVLYPGTPETDAVITAACAGKGARLHPVDLSALTLRSRTLDGVVFDYGALTALSLPLLGLYQPKNAATALTALTVLREKGWPVSGEAIRRGLARVVWPGRFELLRREPVFLLDGSHNPQGMAATAESLRTLFPGRRFVFLLSVMADKDIAAMLDLLCPLAHRFFTVAAHTPRVLPAGDLAALLRARGMSAVPCATIEEGVARTLETGQAACALGTLYFSGDVRRAFLSANRKDR